MENVSPVLLLLRREAEIFNNGRQDDVVVEIVDKIETGEEQEPIITSRAQTHARYDCYVGRQTARPSRPLFKVEEHMSTSYPVIVTRFCSTDEEWAGSPEELSQIVKAILKSEETENIIQSQS